MLFWLIAALLTLGASLSVLLPLSGRRADASSSAEHDLVVFKQQMAEVERDRATGMLGAAEADEARAEIGRQILRLDREARKAEAPPSGRLRLVGVAAVFLVPLLSWGVYASVGSPDLPSQPLEARLDKPTEESSVEELVARIERSLRANPEDGRGWEMLGPVYLQLGRFDDAANAFRQAIRIEGTAPAREVGLGEALTGAANGKVTDEARAAFERVLAAEPTNGLARFRLAAADAQAGRTAEALAAWNALLPTLGPQSPLRPAVTRAIELASAAQAPGPTAEQVEAADGMSAADRTAMVEGMVASLDQRLREAPQDLEGWLRLVRSYAVLGRKPDATDALKRGVAALGPESEGALRLNELGRSLELESDPS